MFLHYLAWAIGGYLVDKHKNFKLYRFFKQT